MGTIAGTAGPIGARESLADGYLEPISRRTIYGWTVGENSPPTAGNAT